MDLRKIIKEEIERILREDDMNADSSVIDGVLVNIEDQLAQDLENINKIYQTQNLDLKNKDNEIKANLQLKSKLDATSPQKKGLEREIPEDQKDYEKRKKQLKDLELAKKGMESAKSEIEKQKIELEKQNNQTKSGQKQSPITVLPSLQSPI